MAAGIESIAAVASQHGHISDNESIGKAALEELIANIKSTTAVAARSKLPKAPIARKILPSEACMAERIIAYASPQIESIQENTPTVRSATRELDSKTEAATVTLFISKSTKEDVPSRNASRVPSDAITFHRFSKLPVAVRRRVWKLAGPDFRVIELSLSKDGKSIYSAAPVPSLLHTCKVTLFHTRSFNKEKY